MDYTLTPYNLIMEKPGRQELQKMYEELADEILMEIVQNIDQEYEKAAVEVAGIVLDKRGVDVPCPVEATVESLKWFGERLPGPLIEIPGFAADESVEIEEMFTENKLPYEKRTVTKAADDTVGSDEYLFYVPMDLFNPAIELLKKYFVAGAEEASSNYYSGECPACGTGLANVRECTDCGLTLAGDYSELLGNHPFMLFLKRNNLLS